MLLARPTRKRRHTWLLASLLVLPLLLVGNLLADENDSQTIFNGSGQPLKAPKNSGGFVINLPNSYNNTKVDQTTVALVGENLLSAYARYLGGNLKFLPVLTGVDVVNDGAMLEGKLGLTKNDGATTVQVLLETSVFSEGGVLQVLTWKEESPTKQRSAPVPAQTWYVLGSSVLLLDVPGILSSAQLGDYNHLEFRLYDFNALERARMHMELFPGQGRIHLGF